jgi:hypothetical protein
LPSTGDRGIFSFTGLEDYPFITMNNTISRFTGYLFHTTSTPGLEIIINQDWNDEYELFKLT